MSKPKPDTDADGDREATLDFCHDLEKSIMDDYNDEGFFYGDTPEQFSL